MSRCYTFYTVAKSKRYCKGVKSIASELTFSTKSNTFYSWTIPFTFCNCNKNSIFNKYAIGTVVGFAVFFVHCSFEIEGRLSSLMVHFLNGPLDIFISERARGPEKGNENLHNL